MNYFEDHIGDYAAATAHLSWDEDLAYRRLICLYYHHEKPIPADVKVACRMVRAITSAQRKAVESVLQEFFTLLDDGWHQKRCDAELRRYWDKQAKAKRSADARWSAQRAQSDGNANASADAMRTDMRTHSEGNAPSNQTPDPNTKPRGESGGNATTEATDPPWLRKALTPDLSSLKSRRIPEDWEPDELTVRWVSEARPDLVPHLPGIVANFREYWQTRTGHHAESNDWGITFRRWIRNERDREDKRAKPIDWDKVFGEQAEGAA